MEYSYQDSVYGELDNTVEIGSFEIVNLRMGVESESWHLNAYIENVTDESSFNSISETVSSGISMPRTLGLEVGYRY